MKVIEINALFGVGSTGMIVRDLQECLLNHDIDCYCVYSGGLPPKENKIKIGNIVDRKIHALLCRMFGKQGYYSSIPTFFLIRKISKLKPDIVHLHNVHNNYINVPLLLRSLSKNNVAVVLTLHDCWFYTGGCFHYVSVNCDKWKTRCVECPKRYDDTPALLMDRSEKIFLDRIKYFSAINRLHIVGVSEWISSEARKSILKNRPIYTIHNGIDTNTYRPIESHLRQELHLEGKNVILGPASKWLSPINKETYDYFVSHMDSNCVLLLFGCSNLSLRVPDNVRLIGYISDREKISKLYTFGDVLVNCSREDTLSTLNIECQACGTPVVTFDSTGLRESVDGKVSRLVPVGDYESLLSSTMEVLLNQNVSYRESCREFVLNNFDKKKNFINYITLFTEILQK